MVFSVRELARICKIFFSVTFSGEKNIDEIFSNEKTVIN